MSDVLAMIPVLRRLVYLRRLFDWLNEYLEASRNPTAAGYPEIPVVLIESLQRLGEQIASVSLLKYCEQLRNLNTQITLTKREGAEAARIEFWFEHLPRAEEQYRIVRGDCVKTVVAWLLIPALIVVVIVAFRSCCMWHSPDTF
jgi:hypothetical protein